MQDEERTGDDDNHDRTRWDVEESGLLEVETEILDDERVLDTNTTDKVGKDGVKHEDIGLWIGDSLDKLRLLPDLGLDTSLVNTASLDSNNLFVFIQETSLGRAIGEEDGVEDRGAECQESNDKHEPLPLGDAVRVRGVPAWGEVDAIGDETGNDLSKSVALECPSDTLAHFSSVVEHGADEHDAGGDATLAEAEKETEGDELMIVCSRGVASDEESPEEHHRSEIFCNWQLLESPSMWQL